MTFISLRSANPRRKFATERISRRSLQVRRGGSKPFQFARLAAHGGIALGSAIRPAHSSHFRARVLSSISQNVRPCNPAAVAIIERARAYLARPTFPRDRRRRHPRRTRGRRVKRRDVIRFDDYKTSRRRMPRAQWNRSAGDHADRGASHRSYR